MKRATLALAATLLTVLAAGGGQAAELAGPRVALLTSAGVEPSPRTLEGQPLVGFLRAERKLGIRGRIVYVGPTEDPRAALAAVARQDYDLIVWAFPYSNPVDPVARAFPAQRFLLLDASVKALPHRPKNVRGTVFHAGEAGYLAGYLAALMESRQAGEHVISAIGGIPYSGVTRWIIGYRAGAKKADPRVVVRVDYSGDFANAAKCRRLALSQIARGSGVLFNIAGACGAGALSAAKDKGVWAVGVDVDQSFFGRQILTSAVIRTDKGLYEMLRRLARGRFPAKGDTLFNLRNGCVGLGRTSSKVPPSFLRRVDSIRRQIVAGKIRVPFP